MTVTDNNNCTAVDDVKVFVKDVPCGNALDPVHAFTPNGDGINDKWLAVYGNSCTVQVSVKVYNRYGSPVYKNDNYQNDWEGTYRGKTLPDGTYYYLNIYKLADGRKIERQGDVTIIR